MKITRRNNKKKMSLKAIDAGQIFRFDDDASAYYMKIAEGHNSGGITVVNLKNGSVHHFDIHKEVVCIDAELVVE